MSLAEFLKDLDEATKRDKQAEQDRKDKLFFETLKGQLVKLGVAEEHITRAGKDAYVGWLKVHTDYTYRDPYLSVWDGVCWKHIKSLEDLADIFCKGKQKKEPWPTEALQNELKEIYTWERGERTEAFLSIIVQALILIAEKESI